jgi:hypothetical protein
MASAELYDPATGTWTETGSMNVPRRGASATLLPDGEVLVAGGGNGDQGNAESSAELYNPVTGTWSLTGAMHDARSDQGAALLPDGNVLVFGGWAPPFTSFGWATAEIYHPATGAWTMASSMNQGRAFNPGNFAVFSDGRPLAAGGVICCGYQALSESEIYDPATDTWTQIGDLNQARAGSAMVTLPDGTAIITGGGGNDSQLLASTEAYNPATGAWSPRAPLPVAVGDPAFALLRDRDFLVAGGELDPIGTPTDRSDVYNPQSDTWQPTSPMSITRELHPPATRLPDGRVLVTGGWSSSQTPTATADIFTPTPTHPTSKKLCKHGGWKTFTNPKFKNQGQCIRFVETGK